MKPIIQSSLLRIFRFSRACFLCGQTHREKTLCKTCQKLLPDAEIFCQICGISLIQSSICGQCLKHPPLYQRTFPCFWYEEPLQTLIHEYKFNLKLFLTPILGKLMAEKIRLSRVNYLCRSATINFAAF